MGKLCYNGKRKNHRERVILMNIDFVFDNEVENFENNNEQDFTAIIEQALKTLGIEDDVEVSCVLVDDERIHEINREYRHIDRSTDVISFAMEDNDQFYVEGMPRTLGDIFISVDHAKKQAEEYGHSLRREMCFLFTHGILHLLGYDHMTDEQEKEMFGLQDKILGALSIEREGA